MTKENISQEFRLKKVDETRNYFAEEIEQMSWWVISTKGFVQPCIIWNTFLF